MTQKANPIVIGIFVVSALLIALTALMVFGASKFFTKTEKFVCYFKSGINGLDIGAPVKYKGVEIGKVEDILILSSTRDPRKSMVLTKLSIDLTKTKRSSFGKFYESKVQLTKQIEDGLRAKLNFQSIVTGMLYIELDYFEEFKAFPLSWEVANKTQPSANSNTPLIWSRGLKATGTWDKNEGVFGDQGGHIAFVDMSVKWYDALQNEDAPRGELKVYNETRPTFNIGQAIRGGAANILKSQTE